MKFFHLSDLHIGKQLYGYRLIENQRAIFLQIVEKAKELRPDAIIIAGDIYDKSVPSGEAYELFDFFLNQLASVEPSIPVLIIAGNHDSPERLQFASNFLERHHIYISTMPPRQQDEHLKKVTLTDESGEVDFYLLPFTKPGYVRNLFGEGEVTDYESAIRLLLEREEINYDKRNVLVSHQFYKAGNKLPETCESETAGVGLQIGGLDVIEANVVSDFDYVALGHIHGQQMVGLDKIRYCGTPLKYSISEEFHNKSISLVTLGVKGEEIQIEKIPLQAMQDVRREKGQLADILVKATDDNKNDFLSVTITDDIEPYQPKEQLEQVYPYLLELRIDNMRTRELLQDQDVSDEDNLSPIEIFREFYQQIHHADMTDHEEEVIQEIISTVSEER